MLWSHSHRLQYPLVPCMLMTVPSCLLRPLTMSQLHLTKVIMLHALLWDWMVTNRPHSGAREHTLHCNC